jgi:predicted aspartyl protease
MVAQGQGSDGQPALVNPQASLIMLGPRLQVAVGLANAFADQVLKSGGQVPAVVSVWALIDTGASQTCIDDTIAQRMGLPVIGKSKMASASEAASECNLYPVHIEFAGGQIALDVLQTPGAALSAHGLLILIGRDFLQHCTMFYNGMMGQITLSAG